MYWCKIEHDRGQRLPKSWEGEFVKKFQAIEKLGTVSLLGDLTGLEKLPRLAAFLGDSFYDDEGGPTARDPGSIYLAARDGGLQVTLKEPSQAIMCRLLVPCVAVLWKSVEAVLTDGATVWQRDPWARNAKKKR